MNFIIKHKRLIGFLVTTAVCIWLIYVLRSVLFPFIFGLILAYLLLPIVKWIEHKLPETQNKWRMRRALVIGFAYVVFFTLFTGFVVYLFSSMKPALTNLTSNAANFYISAYKNIISATDSFTDLFFNLLPEELHQQIDLYIYNLGLDTINNIVNNFSTINPQIGISAIGAILGLAIMPVFVFYILKDWEHIENKCYSLLPVWASGYTRDIVGIVNRVLGRYIRAELVLGLAVGTISLIGFLALRVPFAPLLALIAGLMEMVPVVGPWIAGALAVLLTAALAPEKVGWVVLLAAGIQITENIFLCPRVQSGFMRIHPALTMVLLVIGMFVAGILGFILVLPLAATIREVYKYVQGRKRQYDLQNEILKTVPPVV
jgi:predicted PurR-regulated permease PerM